MNPAPSPFLHWTGDPECEDPESLHPPSQSNGLALLEAKLADPSINTYRHWIMQGRPNPAPKPWDCPEGDYATIWWLQQKAWR